MKKILTIMLGLLLLSPICLADEIDTTETSPQSDAAVADADPNALIEVNDVTDTEENIFTNDPQSNYELQGFLEYTEPPQDTIYLDEGGYKNSLNLKAPSKIGSKSLITSRARQNPFPELNEIAKASKFSNMEYSIAPVSSSYSGKSGNFSMGTMYNSGLSSAQLSFSTGVFTKYDGKHFSVMAAFSKNTKSTFDSYTDKIYFAPELKLTKRLSLLDIMQTDVMQTSGNNEVVLRYTPPLKRFADDVQFELGAGQSFSRDKQMNSSLRFSTKFRL